MTTNIHTAYAKSRELEEAMERLSNALMDRTLEVSDMIRDSDPATVKMLEKFAAALESDRAECERLLDDAWDVGVKLDSARLEEQATSDLAEIALDVQRGIRDHDELLDACKRTTTMYAL